ncbi:MAG: PD-(D/E)XK nuclease family protein [Acidiferrobacterales bacterium]
MSADSPVIIVPYGQDPLARLAETLLDRHAGILPDLSAIVVLLAQGGAVPRFRHLLLEAATHRGFEALLPPTCTTLNGWVSRFAGPGAAALANSAREIVLLGALNEHPDIVRRTGAWPLVDSLLALFDELELNSCPVPETLSDFTRLLADSYGVQDSALEPLGMEARWVFVLWRAWQRQLAELSVLDGAQAYRENLRLSALKLESGPVSSHVYLVGCLRMVKAEQDWTRRLIARGLLTVVLHGQSGASGYHPDAALTELAAELARDRAAAVIAGESQSTSDDPNTCKAQPAGNACHPYAYTLLLDQVFAAPAEDTAPGREIAARARRLAQTYPASPARGRLYLHESGDAEQEARAIDLQVRQWWLEGTRNIGIVTNDRKLGRRVRALLERGRISVRDAAGWPLSTTSAATALIRWLESVESDFAYAALLDVLKSPFISATLQSGQPAHAVVIFEEGLLRRCNLASGLVRYRDALTVHSGALDRKFGDGAARAVAHLLGVVESAGNRLSPMISDRQKPAIKYLNALVESLEALGIPEHYAADEAGLRVLDELAAMRSALAGQELTMSWSQFRAWLGRTLERHHFRPPMSGGGVELMGLPDSRLYHFEAVIIAGCERDHLPVSPEYPAFFNEAVRRQLGLPRRHDRLREQLYDFRRLLESAPRVLVTLHREQDGQPVIPSPWVERLRAFHRLAYGDALGHDELSRLLNSSLCTITHRDDAPLPRPAGFPKAPAPPALCPSTVSASSHQRLLDCPYQFFGCDMLGLQSPSDIREDMDKAGYGQRVHRILQAFHSRSPGLPGPFSKPLDEQTAPEAATLLAEIGDAVFAEDLKRSFHARGWWYRWRRTVPLYIDWQKQRAQTWQVYATEADRHTEMTISTDSLLVLNGRLDRMDHSSEGYAIIDYKTGAAASLPEILSGEQAQLPFYALLVTEPLCAALLLSVDEAGVREKAVLTDTDLTETRDQVGARMGRIFARMRQGSLLPAWGDDETCSRCALESLCRKQMWE